MGKPVSGGSAEGESVDSLLREIARVDDALPEAARSDRPLGSRLGRFVLQSELGRGGMGVVYRALDETLGRAVALKVLPEDREGDLELRARFLREARSAAAIVHPNVATVYESGAADASLFIAMELVQGETLRARFAEGRPLPTAEALRVAKGIAQGLAAAHAQGIVHRDLKPENVMLDANGEPKILDFGLAKLRDTREAPRAILEQQPTDAMSTQEGRLLGTPAYMSPEQASGKALDARSDLFSFGVVMYEALTGGRPFVGDTSAMVLAAVMRDPPRSLRSVNAAVPAELAALTMRCLAKDPADRPASANDVLAALEAIGGRRAKRRRPSVLVWIGGSAIVFLGALVLRSQLRATPRAPVTAEVTTAPRETATRETATPPATSTPSLPKAGLSATASAAPSAATATATHVRATATATPSASPRPSASVPRRDPLGDQH